MHTFAEIQFSHFFSRLMIPGEKLKSQNNPVIVGRLIRYNSLTSLLV